MAEHDDEVNAPDESGNTPLHDAARNNDSSTVQWLLQAGANPNHSDHDRRRPLHEAAEANAIESAEVLLAAGASPNVREEHLEQSPLHRAALFGSAEVAEKLIEAGANPNERDSNGDTPLHLALSDLTNEKSQLPTIDRLIKGGANPDLPDSQLGRTPLNVATVHGKIDTVDRLLKSGASPDYPDKEGSTPLHAAARQESSAMTDRLLEAGASPHARAQNGHTPLHQAASFKSTMAAERLLQAGADPNSRSRHGQTPLHLAASAKSPDTVERLLEAGADPNQQNEMAWTPLHTAAVANNTQTIGHLLKAGADLRSHDPGGVGTPLELARSYRKTDAVGHLAHAETVRNSAERSFLSRLLNREQKSPSASTPEMKSPAMAEPAHGQRTMNGTTPLHEAAAAGDLHLTYRLLRAKANPNARSSDGNTPLHYAAAANAPDVTNRLLKSGANPNARDDCGDTPLHIAVSNRASEEASLPTVNRLINGGADLNLGDKKSGATPLIQAASLGKIETTNRLLEAGASPDIPDSEGLTPLHAAARQPSSKITERLLQAKANLHARTPTGHTPLHQAALFGSADSAELLLQAGASPKRLDNNQQPPLHLAASAKLPTTVELLLEAGANPNARDEDGWTPLHSAAAANSTESIDRLLKAGSDLKAHRPGSVGTPLEVAKKYQSTDAVAHLARVETVRNSAERSHSRIGRWINRFRPLEKDVPDEIAHGRKEVEASESITPKIIEKRMQEYHQQQHRKENPMPQEHWNNSKSARQFTEQVAGRVAKQVDEGKAPWQKGWDKPTGADHQPFNPATLKRFKGINAVQLRSVAEEKGYSDPRWTSYHSANKIGAKIRKGERGTRVEYLRFPPKSQDKDSPSAAAGNKEKEQPKISHRTYVVFNAEQIERMPSLESQLAPEPKQWEVCERAERMMQDSGVKVEQPESGQSHSHYDKAKDAIVMPEMEKFKTPEAYYSQATKEMANRAGATSQKNVSEPQNEAQQHSSIARQDMRSEMACLTINSRLHLPKEPTGDRHKATWAETIKSSPNELRYAARDADRIADKVLKHDRPQQRLPTEPAREAVASPATPERMMEAQKELQQQPQREMAAAVSR